MKNELKKTDGADEADEEGSREKGRWREEYKAAEQKKWVNK